MSKIKNILFICTGNTCRSPMAQVIFESLAQKRGIECECKSAGIAVGTEGRPASEGAILAVKRFGIDLSGHRSVNIRTVDLDSVDLFVALTTEHATLLTNLGIPKCKIYVMNIPDPYGGSQEVYDDCCDEIKKSIENLIGLIESDNEE